MPAGALRGRTWAGAAAIALAAAAVLRAMGRRWWCACGGWTPFAFDVWSPHDSQHLVDPYSPSHFEHGLVFFWALAWLLRRASPDARLLAAVALEAGWEILENTPMVIAHYRATTISLDYTGDTVANSLSDVTCRTLGYLVARRLPGWGALALFAALEVATILWIRDSLLLNVLMLLWPLDAVRRWQTPA